MLSYSLPPCLRLGDMPRPLARIAIVGSISQGRGAGAISADAVNFDNFDNFDRRPS